MFDFLGFAYCAYRHVSYKHILKQTQSNRRNNLTWSEVRDFKHFHKTDIRGFLAWAHFPPDICLKEVNEMLLGNKTAGWECHENGWCSERKSENTPANDRWPLSQTVDISHLEKENIWSYRGSCNNYLKLFCVDPSKPFIDQSQEGKHLGL